MRHAKVLRRLTGVPLAALVVGLVGCANSMEQASEALEAMPEKRCSYENGDGDVLRAEGAGCSELIASVSENQARAACAEFSSEGENLCLMALALKDQDSGDGRRATARDLLVAAIQADSNIKSAWIGTVPVLGGILGQAYNTRQEQRTLQEAFANAGPRVGELSVGGAASGGKAGEGAAGASSEANENVLTLGNDNNVIRGPGNVLNEGRNPLTAGTGQPESTLDGDTIFQNEAPANAAPTVQGTDDADGGQSFVPELLP